MKKHLRKLVMLALALAFVFGAGNLALSYVNSRQNAQAGEEARQLAGTAAALPSAPSVSYDHREDPPVEETPTAEPDPEPEPEPEPVFDDPVARQLLAVDLAALRAENPDVLGWITIPDTVIAYPLMQGEDNDYYLKHTWQKVSNFAGSIFMECRNSSDFSDFNTIIYGHRMKDGSMFNGLKHYEDAEYLAQHPRVYIVTAEGVRVYEVFASATVTVTDPVYWLITHQEAYKQRLIDFCLERSAVDTGIVPETTDRLLVLSTCTSVSGSDNRWIVAAVELGVVEHPAAEAG